MIRLFVGDDLKAGGEVAPSPEQVHYLIHVMRLTVGAELLLFNGRHGEWRAKVVLIGKGRCDLGVEAPVRAQSAGPDVDLIVAMVKRARLEVIVEKAAELGARRVRLVITERANAGHANIARLTAIAVEAAEQTGRLDVPEICAPRKLARVLAEWDADRRLMFCDEAGGAPPALAALTAPAAPALGWAILIGPEGGFSPAERARCRAVAGAVPVSLGPRILRADTAAIAAISLWQSALGDWRGA
jgi:16S rRNA (uracil1498-N3)-methyltransferase